MKRRKISKKTSTKTKSDFLSAVFHGDKKKILNYLKNNWDIKIRTGRTSSLLYLAIKQKNFSLIELLLDNGAEINGALQTVGILEGYTALHIASGDNDEKLVRYLIARGADVNFSAPDGGQPIHAAVYFQNINIVKILLENGADINANYPKELYIKYLVGEKFSNDCYEEINLLIHGIIKKNYGLVKLLIEHGADLRNCKKTVLLHAIESNSQEIVQLIINNVSSLCNKNKGIKLSEFINATYPSGKFSGYTCLHLACKNENPFSVLHLIQNGGNVNAVAEDGVQPIHLAVLHPNVEIIEILIDNGAHIDALFKTHHYGNFPKLSEWVHSNDITLMTHSILYGNINVVKLLLEYNVIRKTSHRFIKNIVFYAAESNNLEIMMLILEKLSKIFGKMTRRFKSFVNVKYSQGSYSGYTPLHMACRNKNLSCVELLMQNGANVLARAADGAQPIHVALIIPENEEIIKLLLDRGADVNAKYQLKFLKKHINNPSLLDFNNNFTLINYAIFVRDSELVELLLDYEANVNIKNNLNKTLLMYAVENNLTRIVDLLLNNFGYAQNIDVRDNSGRTALHYVLDSKPMKNFRFSLRDLSFHYTEKGEIANMLLNAGANVFAMIHDDPKTLIANSAAYRACPQVLNVVLTKQLTIQRDFSSPLTYATKEVDYKNDFNKSYGHLRKDIVKAQKHVVYQHCIKYIVRRQGIGFEVADSDIFMMNLLINEPDQRALNIFHLETEISVNYLVNKLKAKFIAGTRLSYFDILGKDVHSLAGYLRKPEIIMELAMDNYRNELRYYYSAFRCKWAQAFLRRKLLDACNSQSHKIVTLTTLPYDVMLIVFEYIDSNQDLKNFLLAAITSDHS